MKKRKQPTKNELCPCGCGIMLWTGMVACSTTMGDLATEHYLAWTDMATDPLDRERLRLEILKVAAVRRVEREIITLCELCRKLPKQATVLEVVTQADFVLSLIPKPSRSAK